MSHVNDDSNWLHAQQQNSAAEKEIWQHQKHILQASHPNMPVMFKEWQNNHYRALQTPVAIGKDGLLVVQKDRTACNPPFSIKDVMESWACNLAGL